MRDMSRQSRNVPFDARYLSQTQTALPLRQADFKGRLARQIFGFGCPIYARLEIRDVVTKDVLFKHNGSLKGIAAKEAAETS
jgi:hypothetical protein